jgi:hypothetical protein
MWTERQTDMMKLIVAFRNFAKGLNNINTFQKNKEFYGLLELLEPFTGRQIVHTVPHKTHIAYAYNTTILHASTSTINTVYKNCYNFRTTFNKDFNL